MANSKSNIYPIQLQGAELNLNKYDAEIKQYSGFNKNNSPFVGGCLSNVFHKEETIEDANDNNTYIDENGDVYRVTTEGLFKNSDKLVDYTGKDFISVEKIETSPDVVKVYAEDLFLRRVGETYYLNEFELGNVSLSYDESLQLTKYTCGVWVHGVFIFAGLFRNDILKIIALKKNTQGEYEIYHEGTEPVNEEFELSIGPDTGPNDDFSALSIIASGTTHADMFFCVIFSYYLAQQLQDFIIVKSDMTNSMRFTDDIKIAASYETGWTYNDSPKNIDAGYPTNGKFKVKVLSYPRNELIYEYLDLSTQTTTLEKKTAIRIRLNAQECTNSGNPLSLKDENVLESLPVISRSYEQLPWNTYVKTDILDNSFVDFSASIFKLSNGVYRVRPYTTAITINDEFKVAGGATMVMKDSIFAVMLNNNVITGIAAVQFNEKYNNCYTKILVTNWNTVKEELLSYVEDSETGHLNLIYGDNNNSFYILKKTGVPVLKRVNNQIITNVLYGHNSWFLKKNKLGCFALGFNASKVGQTKQLDISSFDNLQYYSASINEYNLQDNASILLNPVKRFFADVEVQDFCQVNVYSASSDDPVSVIYRNSYKILDLGSSSLRYGYFIRSTDLKLIGLQFPIDTNGNVSYCPSLFSDIKNVFGNQVMIKENDVLYFLQKDNNEAVMSYYMLGGIENITEGFIIQGQYYGIINNKLFGLQFNNGVIADTYFIVNVQGLQFVGNTPYEALFFSKTNRCLYSFTGANVLNQKQLVDKISEVRNYLYNPATQTVFLITDIGVLFYGLFGMFLLEYTDITNIFLLDNGIVMSDNSGNYRYIKYYLDEGDEGYTKENIRLETCFYGMNNEVVTINDCLYFRLFSEEHEEGDLKVKATTISLKGRQTEETTFKIKASDWDKITHTIYLRYQPKTQRGLGVSFSIDSPFKIASMSVGSQPDAVLVDKVSKGAITAPSVTTNNNEW